MNIHQPSPISRVTNRRAKPFAGIGRALAVVALGLFGLQARGGSSLEEALVHSVRALAPAHREIGSACAEDFLNGAPPKVLLPQLSQKTRQLCSPGYAVLHSGVTRTPLWSAEHLTPERIRSATHLSRQNSFRPDERVPTTERAELADYARSGWDRGHMSPNKDMPDRNSQGATFLLSNMIPQAPMHNQHLWESIEHATRALVLKGEEAYVVTGPAFLGNVQRTGNVAIPTHVWKAVYLPQSGRAAAWWTANRNPTGEASELISVDELAKRTGVNAFPSLTGEIRQHADELGKPASHRRSHVRPD